MQFRLAKMEEAAEIAALYHSVNGLPFCTWDETYPGAEEIQGDLATDCLFVLENEGTLVGAISIVPENELDDRECWTVKENASEFARVVIRPSDQGKGLSRCLVEGVIEEMRKRGAKAVHLSVAKQNIPAQKLYRREGFEFVGEADMYGHSYFLCEKLL